MSNYGNPVESLAQAVYSALENSTYLPNIQYNYNPPGSLKGPDSVPKIKFRRPRVEELEIHHFPQHWGSTALGFGGIGAAAMSTAYTTVIIMDHRHVAVFFNGQHAYTVLECDLVKVQEDLAKSNIASVGNKKRYVK